MCMERHKCVLDSNRELQKNVLFAGHISLKMSQGQCYVHTKIPTGSETNRSRHAYGNFIYSPVYRVVFFSFLMLLIQIIKK